MKDPDRVHSLRIVLIRARDQLTKNGGKCCPASYRDRFGPCVTCTEDAELLEDIGRVLQETEGPPSRAPWKEPEQMVIPAREDL